MLVRPGLEPAASRLADRRLSNWANRAAVLLVTKAKEDPLVPINNWYTSYDWTISHQTYFKCLKTMQVSLGLKPFFEIVCLFNKNMLSLEQWVWRAKIKCEAFHWLVVRQEWMCVCNHIMHIKREKSYVLHNAVTVNQSISCWQIA